jgi:hypothetical protein
LIFNLVGFAAQRVSTRVIMDAAHGRYPPVTVDAEQRGARGAMVAT